MTEVQWDALDGDFLGQPASLTIGVFDGIHRGHRALIDPVALHDGLSVVVTFERHPSEQLLHDSIPGYIMSIAQRRDEFASLGIDLVVLIDFDASVRSMPGSEFLRRLLSSFTVTSLVIGYDFAVGKNRAFGRDDLMVFAEPRGIEVMTADPVQHEGSAVSSSRVRASIRSGHLREAERLLGRPYALDVTSESIRTDDKARVLRLTGGRLVPGSRQLVPPDGSYPVELVAESGKRERTTLTVDGNYLHWPLADGNSIRYIVMNQNRNGPKE